MKKRIDLARMAALLLAATAMAGCNLTDKPGVSASADANADASADPDNWVGFGRTAGEQHYSPLADINADTVGKLGLAWSMDLDVGNSVTAPIAVDGVLYFASGYSIVHAVDAATGKLLWRYDPKVPEVAGRKMRQGWGSRGIAYWNGKVYTGAHDGRLIAIDAKTGKPLWSAMTVDKDDVRFVSGPPRVFDGKVIIGHGGADVGSIRGYATAYDAETGKQLWRFWTVPGNPADGFEDKAMEMAAKTWFGEWWKYGGGGTVWNSFTYDAEQGLIFLGVGNGAPWNRKIRSAGKGDNLFLSSIVALKADTGEYVWHYQTNPGESWDYNAAMDMELATLTIDGKPRKVLMTAPKNGFFYVIDRTTGKVISAEPIAKVNWAKKIDLETGRPVENPNIRYEEGPTVMWPGPVGAHTWLPMSFSPKTNLVYIPVIEMPTGYDDKPIDLKNWKRAPGHAVDGGVVPSFLVDEPGAGTSALLAWNPVTQKQAWRLPTPGFWGGGTMVTGGNLLFQGHVDHKFNAFDAVSGKLLWAFDAKAPVIAPPITYRAGGKQMVTVLTGYGTSVGAFGSFVEKYGIDYRTMARRVLTFALDGTKTLPDATPFKALAPADPGFVPDKAAIARGEAIAGGSCMVCHGVNMVAAGQAPDLRTSSVPQSAEAFASVVRDGALVPMGMPRFEELSDRNLADLQQYLREKARELREKK